MGRKKLKKVLKEVNKNRTKGTASGVPVKDGYHCVKIVRDNLLEWPDLWCEVYLAGENEVENALLRNMFAVGGRCREAKTPEEADIVVFGGGVDVDPAMYGELPHSTVYPSRDRDKADSELYQKCYDLGIPMLGICRGAQFGHVMNGGKLFQHVDNHQGEHGMWLTEENRILRRISSVHHQMIIPTSKTRILGVTPGRSSRRYKTPTVYETSKNEDVEAFFYRDTCFLGIQGHPEYSGFTEFRHWVMTAIKEFLVENTDLILVDNNRRLKKEIMDKRNKKKETA